MQGNWKWKKLKTENPKFTNCCTNSAHLVLSWFSVVVVLPWCREHLRMDPGFAHETHVHTCTAKQPPTLGYYIPVSTLQKTHLWIFSHWSKIGKGSREWCQNPTALSQWMQNGISNKWSSKTYGPLASALKNQLQEFEKDMDHERISVTAWQNF